MLRFDSIARDMLLDDRRARKPGGGQFALEWVSMGERCEWSRLRVSIRLLFMGLVAALAGCSPSVDIAGVYFPGWLVSAITGVVLAYAIVITLSCWPKSKELADSGLFFLSLVGGIALGTWWILFSGF